MSDDSDAKAAKQAEEAYAAAVVEASVTPVEAAPEPVAVVTEKAKVAKPRPAKIAAEPVVEAPVEAPRAVKPKVQKPRSAKPKPAKTPAATAKPVRRKPVVRNFRKPATPKPKPAKSEPTIQELKEKIMATAKKTTPEYTKLFATAQTKAKAAYTKGAAVASEIGTFSKGNVEAVVASGKILADGVKALGKDYVAESKSAIDTLTGDFKAFAAIKSPTELFQLQGKLARRNFDTAVAFGSKTSESLVKLANEAFAPISNRVSLAVDKVSKAA